MSMALGEMERDIKRTFRKLCSKISYIKIPRKHNLSFCSPLFKALGVRLMSLTESSCGIDGFGVNEIRVQISARTLTHM